MRTFLLLLLIGCGPRQPLQLDADLAPMLPEAEALGAALLPDLQEWRILVVARPMVVTCGDSTTAVGCTNVHVPSKLAYIRLAIAPGWTLEKTAFLHELTHVWLAAVTACDDLDRVESVGLKPL